MVGSFSRESRPERVNRNANEYYNANEADRYTTTSNAIQKDLTYKALELLGVQEKDFYFVADIGCGSGLSSRILSLQGLPWIGTDISLDMLSLAQTQQEKQDGNKNAASTSTHTLAISPCKGHLTASDMSQGLPFRSEAFDLAISISAVQWLCYNKAPKEAAERFFKSVWRCLKVGGNCSGRAAFQVYLENDEHKTLLLEAAISAGFLATYFMDYPHRTPAKKFYICLSKSHTSSSTCKEVEAPERRDQLISSLSRCCCNLAWPAVASCSLPWLTWREESNPRAARAFAPRIVQEHASVGKRVLRLLRHAAIWNSSSEDGSGENASSSSCVQLQPPTLDSSTNTSNREHSDVPLEKVNGAKESLVLEIAVPHTEFMPCGGPFVLQLFVNKESLLAAQRDSNKRNKGRKRERESVDKIGEERREKEEIREEQEGGVGAGKESEETLPERTEDENLDTLETLLIGEITPDQNGGDLDVSKSNKNCKLSPVVCDFVQKLIGCTEAEVSEAYYTTSPLQKKEKNGKKEKEDTSIGSSKSKQTAQNLEQKMEIEENKEESKVEKSLGSWTEHFRQLQNAQQEQEEEGKVSQTHLTSKKTKFFYLEHITGGATELEDSSSRTSIAVLHATKPPLPEILVLTSNNHVSNGSGSSSGSLENVHRQLVSLCKEHNACVIGVDMLVYSLNNVSCAWLVYVPELQTTERTVIWKWSRWNRQQE